MTASTNGIDVYLLMVSNYCLDGPGYLGTYLLIFWDIKISKDGPGDVDTYYVSNNMAHSHHARVAETTVDHHNIF